MRRMSDCAEGPEDIFEATERFFGHKLDSLVHGLTRDKFVDNCSVGMFVGKFKRAALYVLCTPGRHA